MPKTVAQLEIELAAVEATRDRVLTTMQSITSPDGRTHANARLDTLLKEIHSLESRISRASNNDRRLAEF